MCLDGGGYGQGEASQDVSELMGASNNSFVAVIIQYRVRQFTSVNQTATE